jgi:hypothetical protein
MKNILSDVEEVLEKYHKIGLMVSGGLDSSLLAYLLLHFKYKNQKNNEIVFFVVPRPDDSVVHVNRVVDYLDNHFNQPKSTIHIVGTGELHHSKQVTSGMKDAVLNYDCDIYLSSTTTNPPELLPNYEYGKFREPDGTPYNGPIRKKSWHPKLIDIFWDYTKEDTVKIVKDMNLVEIMNLTHTCTGSKLLRCEKCWQCCERAWAFNKNNFVDTGTM